MLRRLTLVLLALALAWCFTLPASAQEDDADIAARMTPEQRAAALRERARQRVERQEAYEERAKKLHQAVDQLIEEAKDLDEYAPGEELTKPHFNRPHPLLRDFGPEYSMQVLERMLSRFTGNEYRDTYIRWHLNWVVKRATVEDRREMGTRIIELIRKMPETGMPVEHKPVRTYDPPEIASRYFGLRNSGNKIVGYPPFQKVVGWPASAQYMSAEEQARVRERIAEAQTLREQFTVEYDKDAAAFNDRIRRVNHAIRQYRGELMYGLLQTGDPAMAIHVAEQIERKSRQKDGQAFDLLSYLYLAAYDGVLSQYPAETLKEMSGILRKAARGNNEYVEYGGASRNFADYAFHMIYMLEDGGGFIKTDESTAATSNSRRGAMR